MLLVQQQYLQLRKHWFLYLHKNLMFVKHNRFLQIKLQLMPMLFLLLKRYTILKKFLQQLNQQLYLKYKMLVQMMLVQQQYLQLLKQLFLNSQLNLQFVIHNNYLLSVPQLMLMPNHQLQHYTIVKLFQQLLNSQQWLKYKKSVPMLLAHLVQSLWLPKLMFLYSHMNLMFVKHIVTS